MNTAVEAVVNLVSPEYHPLAGRAKDVAAGAVLVGAVAALVVGLLIFGPRVWALFVA
jgi:diacylglycerol kinase (ATP)